MKYNISPEFVLTRNDIVTDSRQGGPEFELRNRTPFKKNSYSLIIPAYNEEKRIGNTLKSLISQIGGEAEIIIVFDGNDRTPEIVKSFGNRVNLLVSDIRLGKGGAIIEGFKAATSKVVGFVDADNAFLPSDISKLANMVSYDFPCVIGSRWVRGSTINRKEPFFNILAGRMFHYLVLFFLHLRVKDTQCGIKFFTKELVEEIMPRITVKSRMFDVAILYHIRMLKRRILEVGITWTHKEGTKLPIIRAIPLMFATLIGIKIVHDERFKKSKSLIVTLSETIKDDY